MSFVCGNFIYVASAYGLRAFEVSTMGSVCLGSWTILSIMMLVVALQRQTVLHGKVNTVEKLPFFGLHSIYFTDDGDQGPLAAAENELGHVR